MSDYKHPSNRERYDAMMALRRSSAATPQESQNKRLKTKQTVIAQEKKDED